MRVSKYPSCCSGRIIHSFYEDVFASKEQIKKKLENLLKIDIYKDYYAPKFVLIALSEVQYKIIKDLLLENGFKIIFTTKGNHNWDVLLLIKEI